MNWLNLLVLIVFILCIMNGIRRGFIRTAASMASFFISMALVYFLNPYVVDYIENKTPVYQTIEEKCSESIAAGLEERAGNDGIYGAIDELPLPESLKPLLKSEKVSQMYEDTLVKGVAGYLAPVIAHMIVNSLSFLITFFLVSVFIQILFRVLDGVFSLPVLSLVNRLAGAAVGCIQGVFIIWMIFLILFLFFRTSLGQEAAVLAESNPFTKWLYDSNWLLKFIGSFLK